MGHHSSSKPSSSKKTGKPAPKPDSGSYNTTDAWICEQSANGPWDGVDVVNASQWNTPGYESYQHPASVAATQGSSKPHKKKDHKSSGKK